MREGFLNTRGVGVTEEALGLHWLITLPLRGGQGDDTEEVRGGGRRGGVLPLDRTWLRLGFLLFLLLLIPWDHPLPLVCPFSGSFQVGAHVEPVKRSVLRVDFEVPLTSHVLPQDRIRLEKTLTVDALQSGGGEEVVVVE